MKKIETIWHHLLWSAIEKGEFKHTQKSLANYFGYSLSTVNLAIKKASLIGAVQVSGKFFVTGNPKKLLYFWATHRNIEKDMVYETCADLPVSEIEGLIPPQAIMASYTTAKKILGEAPADYSKVFFYLNENNLETAIKRFPPTQSKNPKNIFVLKSYLKQPKYGQTTSLPQTFVDIWGQADWYAKDFIVSLEEKIDEVLP